MSTDRWIIPLTLLGALWITCVEPVAAQEFWYELHNHPDNELNPPSYGLRIDELFNVTGGTDIYTFDFDAPQSSVRLYYNADAQIIRIYGSAMGGRDIGAVHAADQFLGLYQIYFEYNVGVGLVPSDDDIWVSYGASYLNHGLITGPPSVGNGQIALLDATNGIEPYTFRFGNEDDDQGHSGFDGLSGWGWLQVEAAIDTGLQRAWSFTAEPTFPDCNNNSVPDDLDVFDGTSADCNFNNIPDECEDPDCDRPDLVVTSIDAPASGTVGEPVQIRFIVENTGIADAVGPWTDRISFSNDDMIGNDVVAASIPYYGTLAPTGVVERVVNVALPTTPGSYRVVVRTDAGQVISEDDGESNNDFLRMDPISVMPTPRPDLVVVPPLLVPANAFAGELFELSFILKNQGNATADGPWISRVYFSIDDQIGGDIPAKSFLSPAALGPNQDVTISGAVMLPGTPGTYFVVVTADPDNAVNEGAAESNNSTISAMPIVVAALPLPDLEVDMVGGPNNSVTSGGTTTVSWRVRNIGQEATNSAQWTDMVFISASDLTSSGMALCNEEHLNLAAYVTNPTYLGVDVNDDEYMQEAVISIPENVQGPYYVYVIADRDGCGDSVGHVPELNESDNLARSGQFTINLQAQADLVAIVNDFQPSTNSSQSFTVTWTDQNVGAGSTATGVWRDAVYLSENNNNTSVAGDRLLGYRSRVGPPLAGGATPPASSVSSLTVNLPTIISGTFYVKVKVDVDDTVPEINTPPNNIAVSQTTTSIAQSASADIVVEDDIRTITRGIPGHPLFVEYHVASPGNPQSSHAVSWIDRVYLSDDVSLDSNDLLLQTLYSSTTQSGPNDFQVVPYVRTVNAVLPNTLGDDEYFIIVQLDVNNSLYEGPVDGEEEINNISVSAPVNVQASPTNLTITPLDPIPDSAVVGQPVSVSWQVANDGDAVTPVANWRDAIYLSTDSTVGGDVLLRTIQRTGELEDGFSYTSQTSFTIPASVLPGDYHLLYVTDYQNVVYESGQGETDNVADVPLIVSAAEIVELPDLEPTELTPPPSLVPGQPFSVTFRIENTGSVPTTATEWIDRFYLSNDDTLGGGDVFLGSAQHTGALSDGLGYSGTSPQLTLPGSASGGIRYIIVHTDATNQVFESDENNNTLAAQFTVIAPPVEAANLKVRDVFAAGPITAGDDLDVTWTIRNDGESPTNTSNWTDAVYLSANSTLDPGDTLLGEYRHAEVLAQNAMRSVGQTVQIPCNRNGTFFIIVLADRHNEVDEAGRDDDNSGAAIGSTQINALALPNLRVQSVDAPLAATAGQPIEISWTIVNSGTGPTCNAAWQDSVFLSRDLVVDPANDHFLGSVIHAQPLESGGLRESVRTFDVPAELSGVYHVLVLTDSANQIAETLEVDNVKAAPDATNVSLPEPGDLIVGSFEVSGPFMLGDDVAFTWQIRNVGDNPVSGSWYDAIYLSTDDQWSVDDAALGRFQTSASNLTSGQPVQGHGMATIPPVAPGSYYLIVRTDVLNQIVETDDFNNTGPSSDAFVIDVEPLSINNARTLPLPEGRSRYFALTPPADRTIMIDVSHDSPTAGTEIYVKHSAVPNPGSFDFASPADGQANQQVFIPTSLSGTYYILVRAQADATQVGGHDMTIQAVEIPFDINAVLPASVGNGESVTLRIKGSRFAADDSVTLIGANDVVLHPIETRLVDGRNLRARFDLSSAELGQYIVRVTDGEGQNAMTSPEISLEPADPITAIVRASGELSPRAGGAFVANGEVTNTGNVDAQYVTVLATFDGDVNLGWSRPEDSLPRVSDFMVYDWNFDSPTASYSDGRTHDAFYLRNVAPGETVSFAAVATRFTEGPFAFQFNLHAETYDDFAAHLFGNLESARQNLLISGSEQLTADLQDVVDDPIAWSNYFDDAFESIGFLDNGSHALATFGCSGFAPCAVNATAQAFALEIVDCSRLGSFAGYCAALKALHYSHSMLECYREHCNPQCESCAGGDLQWRTCSALDVLGSYFTSAAQGCGDALGAIDPNEKVGPSGGGGGSGGSGGGGLQIMVPPDQIPYRIHFENLSTATANAGTIVLTDELDEQFRASSVRFGDIRIGDVTITGAKGRQFYQDQLDYTSTRQIKLNVTARVDDARREVSWTFESIDPVTGLPPNDPALGILPPNDASGAGTGYVELFVSASAFTSTGSIVTNGAKIRFDAQAPLVTNTTQHTLDVDIPTSAVQSLPEFSSEIEIPLIWTGGDPAGGSGLDGITVYVAKSGSNATAFDPTLASPIGELTDTMEQSGMFVGEPGRKYWFFSIAKDVAGNVQKKPNSADASTIIPLETPLAAIPTLRTAATIQLNLNLNVLHNPAETEYAVVRIGTGEFLGLNGRLDTVETWRKANDWPPIVTIRALESSTSHEFAIRARNSLDATPDGDPVLVTTQIRGDVNGDGIRNQTDIDLVAAALDTEYGQPGFDPAADLDGDDRVTIADLILASLPAPCEGQGTGDFDNNGVVDLMDLAPFVDSLLRFNPATHCTADINADGTADGRDIQDFLEQLL
ncbi:MAG: hypothetical protein H6819_08265 [Phycisphaerales bacterium]|nr:hypothetical protein [Phycisphaerales bacterium]MCB9854201.1 hypothetical protein [Phycisphaerales bacterium]MCB9864278.1 hypothetical protein [Phycisphaerales bacterium]